MQWSDLLSTPETLGVDGRISCFQYVYSLVSAKNVENEYNYCTHITLKILENLRSRFSVLKDFIVLSGTIKHDTDKPCEAIWPIAYALI